MRGNPFRHLCTAFSLLSSKSWTLQQIPYRRYCRHTSSSYMGHVLFSTTLSLRRGTYALAGRFHYVGPLLAQLVAFSVWDLDCRHPTWNPYRHRSM